mmetsp:Transcript_109884/g.309923  ORF Transcript_109884/g.309923 Transcript_109884/m.309923 type:complete len:274 (-) Transcript_109884:193-1014(-)|eukprot:CAMPEP_0117552158 /NCGR_PEP_ID=MMETSP0784-20121206/49563_1 /TAXON_ID=39447 /ORGANISM="" /LENGTH=273 /DNA_ID=CAMNT_0005349221 /DNA_START=89 /DNA_END=910 /DNA_ORIENTATION=-
MAAAPDHVVEYLAQLKEDEVLALLARVRESGGAGAPTVAEVPPPPLAPPSTPARGRPAALCPGLGCKDAARCSCTPRDREGDQLDAVASVREAAEPDLAAHGADAPADGPQDATAASLALLQALEAGSLSRARQLSSRADLGFIDEAGWGCMHWIVHHAAAAAPCTSGSDDCAAQCCAPTSLGGADNRRFLREVLLRPEGAQAVNTRSVTGATPLMFAADAGDSDVCEWLLAAGADCNQRDEDGDTAAAWARTRGHEELAGWLASREAAAAAA